jgi:rhodanese-related sulfurtransferase
MNNSAEVQEILQELRLGRAQLIDVREKSEWEQARFKCAIHVPLSDLAGGKGVEILREIKESGKKMYLHCRSGVRVEKAREVLNSYGCNEFRILSMNMVQMIEEGFLLKGQE